MKRDLLQATDAERGQSKLVLQAAELSLHGGAASVEVAEALGVAGDERVSAVSLHPHGLGLALTGRAAPLGRLALEVGSGEYPGACSQVSATIAAALHSVIFATMAAGW
ncbi:MAG: hypothetical protein ABI649_07530 [Gaiellaceae bacterium]